MPSPLPVNHVERVNKRLDDLTNRVNALTENLNTAFERINALTEKTNGQGAILSNHKVAIDNLTATRVEDAKTLDGPERRIEAMEKLVAPKTATTPNPVDAMVALYERVKESRGVTAAHGCYWQMTKLAYEQLSNALDEDRALMDEAIGVTGTGKVCGLPIVVNEPLVEGQVLVRLRNYREEHGTLIDWQRQPPPGVSPTNPLPDPIIEAVREDLLQRSQVGLTKYGTALDRTDLKLRDWLQHAYEEHLDAAAYLKRAIVEIDNG